MMDIFADRDALSLAAAELFSRIAVESVAARGKFSVVLAGGDTPRRTYDLLAQEPVRSHVPWENLHFFWGDERCVPADDPRNNALMARRALLDHVPVRPEQIHPIPCDRSPQKAAVEYEAELRGYFAKEPPRFDLVFLGLGDDGHTASLLPGSAALAEEVRWTAVTRRAGEEFCRVTLTTPILNQAALVVFLVTGPGKARVLQTIMDGSDSRPILPAQLIRPLSGDLRWLVDREAASLLV